MCMAARSKRPKENEEESPTLAALTMEGDCVLDFYLEQDCYGSYSGHGKTSEGFSVLIDGATG